MIIILLGQSQTAYLEVRADYPSLAGGFGDREQEHVKISSWSMIRKTLRRMFK